MTTFSDGFWHGLGVASGYAVVLLGMATLAFGVYLYAKYRIRRRAQQIAAVPGQIANSAAQAAGSGLSAAGSVAKEGAQRAAGAGAAAARHMWSRWLAKKSTPPAE